MAEGIAVGEAGIPPLEASDRRTRTHLPVALLISAVWLAVVCGAAVLAPVLPLQDPIAPNYGEIAAGPSWAYPLGTDQFGRDILSRLIYGARTSLVVGFAAVLFGMTFGMTLGLLGGYVRGWMDAAVTLIADFVLAFPTLILIMVIVAVRGPSVEVLVASLSIVMIPVFARLARANTLRWTQREFVTASIALGAGRARTVLREVLPNVLPPVLAYGFVVVALVMVAEGSLSFLGFGVQPPTPSWGGMIAEGRQSLSISPHIVLIPALTLLFCVLAFNVLGDYFRERASATRS